MFSSVSLKLILWVFHWQRSKIIASICIIVLSSMHDLLLGTCHKPCSTVISICNRSFPAAGPLRTFGVISFCSAALLVCLSLHLHLYMELRFSLRTPGADHPPLFGPDKEPKGKSYFKMILSLHLLHAYYCIQERSKLPKLPSELAAYWRFFTVFE